MSGAKLPIVHGSEGVENKILVGRTLEVDRLVPELDQLDLGTDGVVIRLLPGKLIITSESVGYVSRVGRAECDTPNVVYTFLELLDCRWYMPGEEGKCVPRRRSITIEELDIVHKPAFESRLIGDGATWRIGGEDPESRRPQHVPP